MTHSKHNSIFIKLFRIFLFIIFLEVFLICGGVITKAYQDQHNKRSLGKDYEYRILVLGDSLSHAGGVDSYPLQLERLLNKSQSDVIFKVINESYPAQNSNIIREKIDEWINEYQPHLAVTMFGMNDDVDLVAFDQRDEPQTLSATLNKFKVMRLTKSLWKDIINHFSDESDEALSMEKNDTKEAQDQPKTGPVPPKFSSFMMQGIKLNQQGQYAPAEKIFKVLSQTNFDDTFTKRSNREYYNSLFGQKKFEQAVRQLKPFFQDDAWDFFASERVKILCKDSQAAQHTITMFKTMIQERPKAERFYNLTGACHAAQNQNKEADQYFQEAKKLSSSSINPVTQDNYLYVIDRLTENNIYIVAMQYPRRDIEPLKNMLRSSSTFADIHFVDNDQTFESALSSKSYDEIFIDRSFGDFGHCSEEGYALIAENLAGVIKDIVY